MIALCVGHSRPGDEGAISCGGLSERFVMRRVAAQVAAKLEERDIACQVIDSYVGGNYSAAMKWLGRKLTTIGATAAVELHFNWGSPPAHGHEWLHWYESVPGRQLAQCLQRAMMAARPGHKIRGLVSVFYKSRGEAFLRSMPCPAVIAEPFFGSNPQEWQWAQTCQPELAEILAAGIAAWTGGPP